MKSIYEASVAYGREHQGTVNIEDFEAGAYYVLEQIEELLTNDSALIIKKSLIKALIEELKKE